MTPERAKYLVSPEGRLNPHMVTLARHLSIAAVIEIELIRAMRLRAMPNVDAGVEADLFFSPLVLARDVTSIVMYPEVRDVLHEDLRLLKDELATAREVIERAHQGMDAAILLEEAAAYYALRDDAKGYAAMQRQLGTVVRELEKPDLDEDLLLWVDQILETLPVRALNSDAGKELSRFFNSNLAGIRDGSTEALVTGTGRDAEQIGFELRSEGLSLFSPPPSGWQSFELPGPLPVRVEVGYPGESGGWHTEDVTVSTPNQETQKIEIPFGLIRFRGDGGDEIRVRPKGPFHELRPKLLVLHTSPVYSRQGKIEHELEDLEWERESRPLRSNASTNVFISYSANSEISEKRIDWLTQELMRAGLTPWVDRNRLSAGDQWNKEINRAITECRAGIVLLDRSALSSDFLRHELGLLDWRRQQEAGFNLYILREADVDPNEIGSRFGPGIGQFHIPTWRDGHKTVVEQLKAQLLPAEVSIESCTAILMDFDTLEDIEKYIDSLRPTDGSESALDSHLDGAVQRSMPIFIRVAEQFAWVRYDQVRVLKGDDPDSPKTRRRWLFEALKGIQLQGRSEPPDGSGESSLRSLLLKVEKQTIDDWRQARYARERAATSTDPPHAMVMIQWDRWFPATEQTPRSFNFYRSGRQRLTKLVGAGGTLWVVTSRREERGGKLRYQLAYRLRDARTEPATAQDLRDKKPYRVGVAAPEDIAKFPVHDATDTLFKLSFMAGKSSDRPGEVGSTLRRTIPHLTMGDVDLLDSLAEQLKQVDEDKGRLGRKIPEEEDLPPTPTKGTIITDKQEVYGPWTKANSPYIVQGEAIVPKGEMLSIEPGVTIKFKTGTDANYSDWYPNPKINPNFDKGFLRIKGLLKAAGNDKGPIIFSRNDNSGYWGVLWFETENVEHRLEYCIIEYGGNIDGVLPDFDASSIADGVLTTQSKLIINNCNIVNNLKSAIHCWSNGDATIKNSIIWNNGEDLGFSGSVSSSMVQSSSFIPNNGKQGNNISNQDPQFVSINNSDYRLKPTSPCIGAGENGVDIGALSFTESDFWLEEFDVKQLLQTNDFYDRIRNPNGKGFKNHYQMIEKQSETLIVDLNTSLTWQQSGSKEMTTIGETNGYIKNLNAEGFAGFNDWRLPTLEEAMTLMELDVRNGVSHIETVFEESKKRTWTSSKARTWVWYVIDFEKGKIDIEADPLYYHAQYVRAVRSGIVNAEDDAMNALPSAPQAFSILNSGDPINELQKYGWRLPSYDYSDVYYIRMTHSKVFDSQEIAVLRQYDIQYLRKSRSDNAEDILDGKVDRFNPVIVLDNSFINLNESKDPAQVPVGGSLYKNGDIIDFHAPLKEWHNVLNMLLKGFTPKYNRSEL